MRHFCWEGRGCVPIALNLCADQAPTAAGARETSAQAAGLQNTTKHWPGSCELFRALLNTAVQHGMRRCKARITRALCRRLDCFIDLGAYKVCDTSQDLSNDLSILLLMMQALVSRMLLPGISNFDNASVASFSRPLVFSPPPNHFLCYARGNGRGRGGGR